MEQQKGKQEHAALPVEDRGFPSDIGGELYSLAQRIFDREMSLAATENRIKHLEDDMDDREVALLEKAGGKWAGSNKDNREATRQRTLHGDVEWQATNVALLEAQEKKALLSAEISGLHTIRKALEYSITDRLTDVLAARVFGNPVTRAMSDLQLDEVSREAVLGVIDEYGLDHVVLDESLSVERVPKDVFDEQSTKPEKDTK